MSVLEAGREPQAAFRALIRVYGLIGRIMQPYFSRMGISGSQWALLRIVFRAEQEEQTGLRMSELGDRLLVSPPSISGLVDRLQRLGYVQRFLPQTDLRCKEVRLTDSGRDLVRRMLKSHGNQIAHLMGGLDSAEQQTLLQLLDKLGNHLDSILNELPGRISGAPLDGGSEKSVGLHL
jgi:DNA-binding MarR family transcriptional regulator